MSREQNSYRSVRIVFVVILFMLLGFGVNLLAESPGQSDDQLPQGEFVVRVYYEEIADIQKLMDYDVHEYNNLAEKYVLVTLNAAAYNKLAVDGWRMEIDAAATQAMNSAYLFNGGYRTTDEIFAHLTNTNTTHPPLLKSLTTAIATAKPLAVVPLPAVKPSLAPIYWPSASATKPSPAPNPALSSSPTSTPAKSPPLNWPCAC